MRRYLLAVLMALAVAPAASVGASPTPSPQKGCVKASRGFFLGTLRSHTRQRLVIWVRGAYKEDAQGRVTEPVDRTLWKRFVGKDAAILLTRTTAMYRWPVGHWALARGDVIEAHVTVCGSPKNPTALVAFHVFATRPDGAEAPPPPSP
jgi:hypothetical protein